MGSNGMTGSNRSLAPFDPSQRPSYQDLDHHWYECRSCGAVSWDSDTAALAGSPLTLESVPHDTYCPGRAFPDRWVRRITQV